MADGGDGGVWGAWAGLEEAAAAAHTGARTKRGGRRAQGKYVGGTARPVGEGGTRCLASI